MLSLIAATTINLVTPERRHAQSLLTHMHTCTDADRDVGATDAGPTPTVDDTSPHSPAHTHTEDYWIINIKRDTRKGSRKADILGDMLSQPVCDGDDLHLVSSETNSVVGFGSVFWV